jgi:hypothetical protein
MWPAAAVPDAIAATFNFVLPRQRSWAQHPIASMTSRCPRSDDARNEECAAAPPLIETSVRGAGVKSVLLIAAVALLV